MNENELKICEFANKIAHALDHSKSSHAYFFVQAAFNDDIEWITAQERLTDIIKITDPIMKENNKSWIKQKGF
jgi:hypothetical protein